VRKRGSHRDGDSGSIESSDDHRSRDSDGDHDPARDFRFANGGPPPLTSSSVPEQSRFEKPPDLERAKLQFDKDGRPFPSPSAPLDIRRRSTNVRELSYRSSPLSRSPGLGEIYPPSSPKVAEARMPTGRSSGHFVHRPVSPTEPSQRSESAQPISSLRPSTLGDRRYQYRPLDDSFIRLIRILPERKTMLRCEILHVSLRKLPQYVAISYAWGDAGDTRRIELEGSLIPISVSLHGALSALRQKSESVLVWADALSIDQQNTDERTQQIGLMTNIYASADSVAVWLGPEDDDSTEAVSILCDIADGGDSGVTLSEAVSTSAMRHALLAVVPLFERDYWHRLWVVQELFNASKISVYCGPTKVPWDVYNIASKTFRLERHLLERHIRRPKYGSSLNMVTNQDVLANHGPANLPDLRPLMEHDDEPLLAVLRVCRRKLASDPKDKLFGVLGILPEKVRNEFRADYGLSLKDIYTEIVDYILKTTESLDVICDAIHFPLRAGLSALPSFVPDWSHIPDTISLSASNGYTFKASGDTKAICRFLDERLNKLEVSAIYLDTVKRRGVAVGTLCTDDDFLTTFLQWRAILLDSTEKESEKGKLTAEQHFAKALSLGQVPPPWERPNQWLAVCYHVFASMLHIHLPYLKLDQTLLGFLDIDVDIQPSERMGFLINHFGRRMVGRCFFRTDEGRIGMGSGYMAPGDIVVIPLGCSTPILLRESRKRGEYRFVGDAYLHGYMDGKAVYKWKNGDAELKKYVLV